MDIFNSEIIPPDSEILENSIRGKLMYDISSQYKLS